MLSKLMKFEFVKRWKALRYVLLGYVLLQTSLLIISRSIFWNSEVPKIFVGSDSTCEGVGTAFVITMLLYFIAVLIIGLLPIIESVFRFDKDLSGKQAVLELMIPIISWKKVVAKLATALCSTIVCVGLATLSAIIFILVNSNFQGSIANIFINIVQKTFESPLTLILGSLYTVFCFASIYLIIFFCIAFSNSFSHKNKFAVPIGIVSFVICISILIVLNSLLEGFPMVKFDLFGTEDSLSSLILSVVVFFAALFGTSWLMEKKIEL
jgi:hypothetical protein